MDAGSVYRRRHQIGTRAGTERAGRASTPPAVAARVMDAGSVYRRRHQIGTHATAEHAGRASTPPAAAARVMDAGSVYRRRHQIGTRAGTERAGPRHGCRIGVPQTTLSRHPRQTPDGWV